MERRFPRLDTMSYAREIHANLAPASESTSCWTSLRRRRFSHQRYEERVRELERAYWSHAVSDRVRVNISSDMQGPQPCAGTKIEKGELRLGTLTEIQGHHVRVSTH